jgi:PIN domain nuclease of toxin-antitoxin system
MVLLDTCALLWLAADQQKLSVKAKKEIEKSANGLFISAISAFEIAIKFRNKKLLLPLPPQEWFPQAIDFHGIREVPLTSAIAISAAILPPVHNDPCDRIIIATAQIHSMRIITCDPLFAGYKQAHVVW